MQTCKKHFSSGSLLNNGSVDLVRRHIQSDTFVRKTHLVSEGGVRLPGSGVASVRLFHHLVHLFEGETFGFGLWSDVLAQKAC